MADGAGLASGGADVGCSDPRPRPYLARSPDRAVTFRLAHGMEGYRWTLNGRKFDESQLRDADYQLREGERVRLRFENHSPMFHAMHLHGHTFQVQRKDGPVARKDTAIVRPMQTVTADFEADNPGQWAASTATTSTTPRPA